MNYKEALLKAKDLADILLESGDLDEKDRSELNSISERINLLIQSDHLGALDNPLRRGLDEMYARVVAEEKWENDDCGNA